MWQNAAGLSKFFTSVLSDLLISLRINHHFVSIDFACITSNAIAISLNMVKRKVGDSEPPDQVRRRLAKGGLAIPVVLSTLGSRPVFGEAAYNCTIPGQMSGNASAPGPPVVCAIGDAPTTYLANGGTELDIAFNSLSFGGSTLVNAIESVEPTADPTAETAGDASCATPNETVNAPEPEVVPPTTSKRKGREPKGSRGASRNDNIRTPKAWTNPTSISQSTAFFIPVVDAGGSRLFQKNRAPTQHQSRRDRPRVRNRNDPAVSSAAPETNIQSRDTCAVQQGTTQTATEPTVVVDARDRRYRGRRKPATLRQVLESTDGGIMPLARATIASYLNARRFAPDYALTPKKVIDMFNAVYVGGTYRVNDTTYWGANEVQAYFETLYR